MLNKTTQQFLIELNQMQKLIFSFYIKRDFGENRFLHEKKLLQQTNKLMHAMEKVRESVDDQKLISTLEQLYEIIFSLDLLKSRLIDHATFEICERELQMIAQGFEQFFLQLIQQKTPTVKEKLNAAIQALELIFQNTLQVVSADPMVFVFFIKDLYALSNELNATYTE